MSFERVGAIAEREGITKFPGFPFPAEKGKRRGFVLRLNLCRVGEVRHCRLRDRETNCGNIRDQRDLSMSSSGSLIRENS